MRKVLLSVVALGLMTGAGAAFATPITYDLVGVKLDDGGSLSGAFTFNADAPTACSTHASPCGTYSNVNITVTGGSYAGDIFKYVLDASPDSTAVNFLTVTSGSDLNGLPVLAFRFTGSVTDPPNGLSDAGGSFLIDQSSGAGLAQITTCAESGCDIVNGPFSVANAGSVKSQATTVPEPLTLSLFATGLAVAFAFRRHKAKG